MPSRTGPGPVAVADKSGQKRFQIGDISVAPGSRATVDLPLSVLSNHTPVTIPVQVVHGRRPGKRLFVSAAIHGDEINGVEIIRRLLRLAAIRRLRGTLLAVPVVNAFGFIGQTRYLPDRRDLNRCFPGSANGSLAAQVAHLFMTEIVARCTHGIDLHTGSNHRVNLPQIRGDLKEPEVKRLAMSFGAPAVLNAQTRSGSLRSEAGSAGIPVLLYEAGEASRFDETAIRTGLRGVVRVLAALGMIRHDEKRSATEPFISHASAWERAPAGGILRTPCHLGTVVEKGDHLGVVADPFGESEAVVEARYSGVLIGRTNLPVVNQGDALFHIARVSDRDEVSDVLTQIQEDIDREFEPDDEEVV